MAYVHYLEGGDMERHLDTFVRLALDHRYHDTYGRTDDLGHVLREAELEVLDKVGDNGLHLDDTVEQISRESQSANT